jgi:hypothetical protein
MVPFYIDSKPLLLNFFFLSYQTDEKAEQIDSDALSLIIWFVILRQKLIKELISSICLNH